MKIFRGRFFLSLGLVVIFTLVLAGCQVPPEPDEGIEVTTRMAEDAVIVVGAGAAGLAAAYEAAVAGSEVILLEKLPMPGGSTLTSSGVIYGAETPAQEREGIEDSAADLASFWQEAANSAADEDLLQLVAELSGETLAWLEGLGISFGTPTPAGTNPTPRAHRPVEGHGATLVRALYNQVRELGVEVFLETTATGLITDENGAVVGVEAVTYDGEEIHFYGKAVVLATGGFARNEELRAEYTPEAAEHMTYARVGSTGDGILMAKEVGACIIGDGGVIGFRGVAENMPYIHPLGRIIFTPAICVDTGGNRFVNEDADHAVFYEAMVGTGDQVFYQLLDSNTATPEVEAGIEKDVVFKGDTLAELAAAAGIDAASLEATVENYNAMAEAGEDTQFGKEPQYLTPITEPPFYAVQVLPATLGTMGGLRINQGAQVLNEDGNVIPGLYAAGEVANGQFFPKTYPAGGTSLQFSFTFGRIAGQEAAK